MVLSTRTAAATVMAAGAMALNNGLGRTPPMGWSSWNAVASNVTEVYVKNITNFLISSGLASVGFASVHVDEGWLKGRYANGTIYEDLVKFPSGMAALGDWVHAQETSPGSGVHMQYGLYTCRGTCQCSTQWYQGPGSYGYEREDVFWIAGAGADFLKVDSCCGSQDPQTAFAEYGLFRDALNATDRRVFFSLCGWEDWYAPVGASLGNSWRISGDGSGWGPLTVALNKMAYIQQYAGPGGWNDPDMLIGPNVVVGGQSDQQARTQFSVWSVLAAPLIISSDLLSASPYMMQTYLNTEVIAVDQDPMGVPGTRLVGENLSYPCGGGSIPVGALAAVQVAPCNASDPAQRFFFNSTDSSIQWVGVNGVLDFYQCNTADGTPVYVYPPDDGTGTCQGKNQVWQLNAQGQITNPYSGKCLDVYDFTGPLVDLWTCNGGANQAWTVQGQQIVSKQTGMCLAASDGSSDVCTNVWGRPLADGSAALAFLNNGPSNTTVTCDSTCFAGVNLTAPSIKSLTVRDLWLKQNITTLTPPFQFTSPVPGDGAATLYRFFPNY